MQIKDEAKQSLLKGVNRVADAVVVTAGAEGKLAVIEHQMGLYPHPTKDGVTILNMVFGSNQYEELGAQLLKQAANKTAETTGDGTTQTVILARELINKMFEVKGYSHVELKRGMHQALEQIQKHISKLKKEVTDKDMEHIATVSANGDKEIGKLIADIYRKVGTDSTIDVKEGVSKDTIVNFVEGIKLERGVALPHFFNEGETCQFDDALVLIYNANIGAMNDIADYVREAMTTHKPLLIIADDVDQEVMKSLIKTKMGGTARISVAISPEFGENRANVLQDLASALGCEVYTEGLNKKVTLGLAKKIVADKTQTVILPSERGLEKERVEFLKAQAENADKLDKPKLLKRISNLKSSVAEILVGGETELEIKEKKDRVDDAVPALRTALKGGYVAGGGATLYYISKKLKYKGKNQGEEVGFNVVKDSITKTLIQILDNAGLEVDNFNLNKSYGFGVDVKKRKVVNMFKEGIIDPALITETALINAVSVTAIALSTDVLILTNHVQ